MNIHCHISNRIRLFTGPPEPVASLRVLGDCSKYNARLTWNRGEELGVETRRFYVEYATNKSAAQNKWYGGQGPPYLIGKKMFAEPGTAVQYNLNELNLVPGANLIFRIRSASDHLIGRASRSTLQGKCITPIGSKFS